MRQEYYRLDNSGKYMHFTVSGDSPRLSISRAGDSCCSIDVDALDSNDCSATFHIEEPSFGLPDGWYDLRVFLDGCCDPCMEEKLLIDNKCSASLTKVENIVFPECES